MDLLLQGEESNFEEKVKLEDLILPEKQVLKIDENLSVEFSDIKQEPLNQVETCHEYDQTQYVDSSQCIYCDASFKHCGQLATIHESCFKIMLEKLNRATEKIQEMEFKNKELHGNANKLQSTIVDIKNEHKIVLSNNTKHMISIVKKHERESKELCEKLSSARKEIKEFAKEREKVMCENEKHINFCTQMELELQKSKLENEKLSCDMEKLKNELNTLKYQLKKDVGSHQNIEIQSELLISQSDPNPSKSTLISEKLDLVSKNVLSGIKDDSLNKHNKEETKEYDEGIQVKQASLKLSKA